MGIKTKEDLKPLLLDLLGDPDVIKKLKSLCKDLVRAITSQDHQADVTTSNSIQPEQTVEPSRLAGMLEEARERLRQKDAELKLLQEKEQQLQQYNENLRQQNVSIEYRLNQAQQAQSRLSETIRQLEQETQRLRNRSALPGTLKDVIERIRQDADLLERFKLTKQAGDELQLLISAVAALSHEGNFKRMWELYQSRQQARRSAIEPADRLVLDTALGWLNINHQNKPHQFDEPAVGLDYKYELHARAAAGMVGDRIKATWLPGVPTLGLKPQVETA